MRTSSSYRIPPKSFTFGAVQRLSLCPLKHHSHWWTSLTQGSEVKEVGLAPFLSWLVTLTFCSYCSPHRREAKVPMQIQGGWKFQQKVGKRKSTSLADFQWSVRAASVFFPHVVDANQGQVIPQGMNEALLEDLPRQFDVSRCTTLERSVLRGYKV